ncbi:alpha/beta fold hydrolase [Haloarchaeobius sp. DFWS5]|uniref:alpha/beta fold hydrolase n=1 Tax=Haloarchaeobius sp. DFWS5 TaxID=3446114 RepID=UPI003EB7E7A1
MDEVPASPSSAHFEAPPRTTTLPDGRTLAFREFGDPAGRPLFVFHGLPGSRLFGAYFADAAAEAGVRIVAPERPGFGQSSPDPGRGLTDWSADVADLAAHLDIDEFAVCGFSGGGPYALACAAHCDRVDRVAVVAGMAPPGAAVDRAPLFRLLGFLSRRAPWLLGPLYRVQVWSTKRGDPAQALSYVTDRPIDGTPVWGEHTVEDVFYEEFLTAFERGTAGAVSDSTVTATPWGVVFSDIDVPVRCWYGTADENVSIDTADWAARALPDAEITRVEGADHLATLVETREAVCSWCQ